jgi:hypothetical protein
MSQDVKLVMREVNNRIHEVLKGDGSEDGDFLCECGEEDCREMVQLTLREYAALRAREDELVARRAHQPRAAS